MELNESAYNLLQNSFLPSFTIYASNQIRKPRKQDPRLSNSPKKLSLKKEFRKKSYQDFTI